MYTYTRILKYFTDMQRRMRKIQNREYFLSHKNNDYIDTIQNNNNQRNMRVIVSSTSANNSSVTCANLRQKIVALPMTVTLGNRAIMTTPTSTRTTTKQNNRMVYVPAEQIVRKHGRRDDVAFTKRAESRVIPCMLHI